MRETFFRDWGNFKPWIETWWYAENNAENTKEAQSTYKVQQLQYNQYITVCHRLPIISSKMHGQKANIVSDGVKN